MIRNYITVGLRNIARYKVFSFINVFGLAAAMSICMLIILMLSDRDRYDQFQENKSRIYRILSDYEGTRMAYATTAMPVGPALKSTYAGIEETTTIKPGVGGDVSYGSKLTQMRGYFAEPSFFRIFSFELERGDKHTALSAPNSVIISRALALRLFDNTDVVGKVIDFTDRQLPFPVAHDDSGAASVPWGSFTVTGVIDIDEYRSHLKFDALVSASTLPGLYAASKLQDISENWESYYQCYTYVLLDRKNNREDLDRMLAGVSAQADEKIKSDEVKNFRLKAQPLGDVQLNLQANDTDERMPRIGYYFLSILAAVIMLSAGLNYTNLSIARALTRAKEIGVRKVTGANRRSLIMQFLSESVIMAWLALLMAIGMLTFLRPAFQGLWVNKFLRFELPSTPGVYLTFLAFATGVGLLAGAYPAFHLSTYQPITVLKRLDSLRPGKLGLRKILSVTQFVISLFFITTSILVFDQFRHYMAFDYGFKPESVVNVNLQGVDAKKLAAEFSHVAGVSTISATDLIPASGTNNGNEIRMQGSDKPFVFTGMLQTDEHFVTNLGIKIIAGQDLPAAGEGTDRFVLVNRQAARTFGYADPRDMVGKILESRWSQEPVEVIGVVEDFRHKLLINEHDIEPLMMQNRPAFFMYLNVKVISPDLMGTVAKLQTVWNKLDNVHSFRYEFFDDTLAATHQGIFDLVSILGFIAILAIIISCLGLLGMATYTAERKRKEVGIRKVLGAPSLRIALLLSRDLMIVLAIAVCIGAPLSYTLNNMWLQRFPNRVDFGLGTVVLGTLVLLILGLLTIGSQTIRASRSNPVDALKEE